MFGATSLSYNRTVYFGTVYLIQVANVKQLPPKLLGADWRASQAEAEAEPATLRSASIAITAPVMENAKRPVAK